MTALQNSAVFWIFCSGFRPELAPGAQVDVWALGISAIEMAETIPPRWAVHPMRVIFQIGREDPPSLAEWEKWSLNFHDFVRVCLVKDCRSRPTTAQLEHHRLVAQARGAAQPNLAPLVARARQFILAKAAVAADTLGSTVPGADSMTRRATVECAASRTDVQSCFMRSCYTNTVHVLRHCPPTARQGLSRCRCHQLFNSSSGCMRSRVQACWRRPAGVAPEKSIACTGCTTGRLWRAGEPPTWHPRPRLRAARQPAALRARWCSTTPLWRARCSGLPPSTQCATTP